MSRGDNYVAAGLGDADEGADRTNEGFHDRARLADGRPVFDGYLLGVSSRWNSPIEQRWLLPEDGLNEGEGYRVPVGVGSLTLAPSAASQGATGSVR